MERPTQLERYHCVRILRARGSNSDEWLTATVGTLNYFDFWSLPRALPKALPGGGYVPARWPVSGVTGPKQQYRIALPELTASGSPRMVRFCLSKGSIQQTLQVVAEHLDAVGVPWLYLCNANGGRLPNHSLASKRHWLAA